MKFSEFNERIKSSAFYEFIYKIINFLKDFKFMSLVLLAVFLTVAVAVSPFIYKLFFLEDQVKTSEPEQTADFSQTVKVCIVGEVESPGVYTLTTEDRIADAINAAGGLTEDADTTTINLAMRLEDEQYISIPSVNDNKEEAYYYPVKQEFKGIVNINTATSAQLQQLPGIGAVIAERIIEYRENAGGFKNKMDIMLVKGIGKSIYDKIMYNITV